MMTALFTYKSEFNININFDEVRRIFKNSELAMLMMDKDILILHIRPNQRAITLYGDDFRAIKNLNNYITSEIKSSIVKKAPEGNISKYMIVFENMSEDVIENIKSHYILRMCETLGAEAMEKQLKLFKEEKNVISLGVVYDQLFCTNPIAMKINNITEGILNEVFNKVKEMCKNNKKGKEEEGGTG